MFSSVGGWRASWLGGEGFEQLGSNFAQRRFTALEALASAIVPIRVSVGNIAVVEAVP